LQHFQPLSQIYQFKAADKIGAGAELIAEPPVSHNTMNSWPPQWGQLMSSPTSGLPGRFGPIPTIPQYRGRHFNVTVNISPTLPIKPPAAECRYWGQSAIGHFARTPGHVSLAIAAD